MSTELKYYVLQNNIPNSKALELISWKLSSKDQNAIRPLDLAFNEAQRTMTFMLHLWNVLYYWIQSGYAMTIRQVGNQS